MIYAWNHMSMPSRASTSFLRSNLMLHTAQEEIVSMPSRASTSFLPYTERSRYAEQCVSMPSRASTSFLPYTER